MTEPESNAAARHARAPAGLRAAEFADLDAVAAIESASFSDPWSRASFASLIGNGQVYFAVVDRRHPGNGGGVAGYVVVWLAADECEIANLAVAPAARGQGLGARLLDAALDAARGRGAAVAYLEVRESNHAARALYASRAFAPVGRRRNYYRRPLEDALVLRRELTRADGDAARR